MAYCFPRVLWFHSVTNYSILFHIHLWSRGWTVGPLEATDFRHRPSPHHDNNIGGYNAVFHVAGLSRLVYNIQGRSSNFEPPVQCWQYPIRRNMAFFSTSGRGGGGGGGGSSSSSSSTVVPWNYFLSTFWRYALQIAARMSANLSWCPSVFTG
jgi:hypothetical protein